MHRYTTIVFFPLFNTERTRTSYWYEGCILQNASTARTACTRALYFDSSTLPITSTSGPCHAARLTTQRTTPLDQVSTHERCHSAVVVSQLLSQKKKQHVVNALAVFFFRVIGPTSRRFLAKGGLPWSVTCGPRRCWTADRSRGTDASTSCLCLTL